MSIARVNEVIAKHDAPANADPSSDVADGGSQATAASGDGSASADVTSAVGSQPQNPHPSEAGDGAEADAGALSHETLKAKLEEERYKRASKRERRQILREREAQQAKAKELEEQREKLEAERKAWAEKPLLERIKDEKGDARAAFEAMRDEALKAGTPEGQIAALQKAYDARMEALEKQLKDEREARETERKRASEEADERQFTADFKRGVMDAAYTGLREEYEPDHLFHFVKMLRDDSEKFHTWAEHLQVDLTADDGTYNMIDILNVLARQQAAHEAGKQRRKQSAAPQSSEAAPQQAPAAKKPTVNGTEARKAGTTIGNDLAASPGSAAPDFANESPKARVARLAQKYG